MKFYVETKDNLTERIRGPIDPRNGFLTVHSMFTVEAKDEQEASIHFNNKFPNNVLVVYYIEPCDRVRVFKHQMEKDQ